MGKGTVEKRPTSTLGAGLESAVGERAKGSGREGKTSTFLRFSPAELSAWRHRAAVASSSDGGRQLLPAYCEWWWGCQAPREELDWVHTVPSRAPVGQAGGHLLLP